MWIPDQVAYQKPVDLDLHCFQNGINQVQHGEVLELNVILRVYILPVPI